MLTAFDFEKTAAAALVDRFRQIVLLPTFDCGLSAPSELNATTEK
jgi:hypothetical protein